jgi:hypothetical protein
MAKSKPSDIVIEYSDGQTTPSLVDITSFIMTINDVEVETLQEQSNSLGTSWEEHLPIGVGKVGPIELGGFFDDVNDGPDELFSRPSGPEDPDTDSRELKITWRGTKTTSVQTYLQSYTRSADRAGLTKFKVKLTPTGAVTEA